MITVLLWVGLGGAFAAWGRVIVTARQANGVRGGGFVSSAIAFAFWALAASLIDTHSDGWRGWALAGGIGCLAALQVLTVIAAGRGLPGPGLAASLRRASRPVVIGGLVLAMAGGWVFGGLVVAGVCGSVVVTGGLAALSSTGQAVGRAVAWRPVLARLLGVPESRLTDGSVAVTYGSEAVVVTGMPSSAIGRPAAELDQILAASGVDWEVGRLDAGALVLVPASAATLRRRSTLRVSDGLVEAAEAGQPDNGPEIDVDGWA